MKISVIVPVYNVQDYLKKCAASIISQTFKDMEIILVDDGSTDSSGQMCDELSEKDSRIKVIHKKTAGCRMPEMLVSMRHPENFFSL